jgi:hypothetical protein
VYSFFGQDEQDRQDAFLFVPHSLKEW